MTTTKGNTRENHVVEFEEGRRIAWRPAEPGEEPPGHVGRWMAAQPVAKGDSDDPTSLALDLIGSEEGVGRPSRGATVTKAAGTWGWG